MSHYIVAVVVDEDRNIEDNVASMLEPYSEVDEHYYEFHAEMTDEEARKKYREWRKDPANKSQIRKYNFMTYMHEYCGYHYERGAWGYNYNNNAKWDWYEVGGRWPNLEEDYLLPNVPRTEEFYRIRDYDFFFKQDEYDKAIKWWKDNIEGNNEPNGFYSKAYYTKTYGDAEGYAKHQAINFVPYAFIDPYGDWHEPGQMGWFGVSGATEDNQKKYDKEWLELVNDEHFKDCRIVWVDCHI